MSTKNNSYILLHILGWLVSLAIPILIYNNPYGEYIGSTNEKFGLPEIVNYTLFISFFYLNAYYFLPHLFFKKKIALYIVIVILILVTNGLTNTLLTIEYNRPKIPGTPFIRLFLNKFLYCITNLAISSSYRMIMDNIQRDRKLKEKENENLKTELSFLRSQISPHFMFNVLNNTVSLARKKSDKLEQILIELSNLMRYMLYESNEEKVSVNTETDYLKSYIDLQKIRYSDDVKVEFKVSNTSKKEHDVEPMLFIPLVENAFKHGVGMIDHPEIIVQLDISEESIFIEVINKISPNKEEKKDSNSGIGLNNLVRRLDLLYPDKHELKISDSNNKYIVTLKLKLK